MSAALWVWNSTTARPTEVSTRFALTQAEKFGLHSGVAGAKTANRALTSVDLAVQAVVSPAASGTTFWPLANQHQVLLDEL